MPPIPEAEIQDAFVVMFNKLKANTKTILAPVIQNLTKLQNNLRRENTHLLEIDKTLVTLNDKKLLLTKLNSKGIMDDTTFIGEINALDKEVDRLKSERRKMMATDSDLEQISELKDIQDYLNSSAPLTSFSKEAFDRLVDSAIIKDRHHIEFKLFGGLSFPERLGRNDT